MNSHILDAVLLLLSTDSEILQLNYVQKKLSFKDLELLINNNGSVNIQFNELIFLIFDMS